MGRVLDPAEDAFGRSLSDYFHGRPGPATVLERDDGWVQPAMQPEEFLRPVQEGEATEKELLDAVSGRILDLGCGAGRHALYVQERGLEVVAIDHSPAAIEVCRSRGVLDARCADVFELPSDLGRFDALLLMSGLFGLAGSRNGTRSFLRRLHELTNPGAVLVTDGVDGATHAYPEDVAYHERSARLGRPAGQTRVRIRYKTIATPWMTLFYPDVRLLPDVVDGTGWRLRERIDAPDNSYYAVLERT